MPLVILLRTVDSSGRYVGRSVLMWIFATSNVVLVMIPKVLAYYGLYGGQTARRGTRSGIHISGVNEGEQLSSRPFPQSTGPLTSVGNPEQKEEEEPPGHEPKRDES
jgi:hypothetical protein